MIRNRSMPSDVLIPVIGYPSVSDAVAWLTDAFGFELRWQVAAHRAQVAVGPNAAIAIVEGAPSQGGDHVMVRVEGIDAHRARARAAGADVSDIGEFPYGERQYTAVDVAGRTWVFTESVADLAPGDWGATTRESSNAH
jgi:uncharacterized glyoxalase superfamily protein PhnB